MTIIFDSEMQKEEFINMMGISVYCPSDLGLSEDPMCKTDAACRKCWEDAVKMEVANGDSNGSN
jgi:hypothetical protein